MLAFVVRPSVVVAKSQYLGIRCSLFRTLSADPGN